jgi:hypothetical protein
MELHKIKMIATAKRAILRALNKQGPKIVQKVLIKQKPYFSKKN